MCNTARDNSANGNGDDGGTGTVATRHRIPDDNSCLFHAVIFLLNRPESTDAMRKMIANTVRNDPIQWNDAMLGKTRDEYIAYILDPTKWGGQVELNILCSIVKVEIAAIDIQTGRVDIYGQGQGYTHRVYMLFSGIHFDAVIFEKGGQAQTKEVSRDDANALVSAESLATSLRSQGGYTDQQTMKLVCQICGHEMNGDYEARLHAGSSGHTDFKMKKSY
jgi:ubiquitin thioesterase OTU1